MHPIAATSALAIAWAITGCVPASTTAESATRAQPVSVQASPANSPEAAASPEAPPMGKRAAPQPGDRVSPVVAFMGGGDGWAIQISNTGAYDHRVEVTNSGRQAQGTLKFEPSADASNLRIVLRGTLDPAGDGNAISVELLKQACAGDDGVAHEHAVLVTYGNTPALRGCGDLAM